jgi:hypothetical protein
LLVAALDLEVDLLPGRQVGGGEQRADGGRVERGHRPHIDDEPPGSSSQDRVDEESAQGDRLVLGDRAAQGESCGVFVVPDAH